MLKKKNEKKCTSSLLWSSLFWSITGGFNGTFNNISVISWRSVLLAEETGVEFVRMINDDNSRKWFECSTFARSKAKIS
jgi:hypothetical protein